MRLFIKYMKIESVEEITNNHFETFVKEALKDGISARTINDRISQFLTFISYCKDKGSTVDIRTKLIPHVTEQPPRRVCYTREEVETVLLNCSSDMQWLFIKIAFDTGMRINELTNLSVSQIHGNRINFIGKGTKAREVYITDETRIRLEEYIQRNRITDRVWLNYWRYPMCKDTIRNIMREAFVRCGHDDFYPHALRHSFGSDIQRRGADIFVIKEMMGHEKISTTQKYLHALDGHLGKLFAQYR